MNSRSTLKEVETELLERGILPDWSYVKDDHFSKHALHDIKTQADVQNFLMDLDDDNTDATEPGPFRWGCSKAHRIREWLRKPFWVRNIENTRAAIAPARRVCCSCHEDGSFAKLLERTLSPKQPHKEN